MKYKVKHYQYRNLKKIRWSNNSHRANNRKAKDITNNRKVKIRRKFKNRSNNRKVKNRSNNRKAKESIRRMWRSISVFKICCFNSKTKRRSWCSCL